MKTHITSSLLIILFSFSIYSQKPGGGLDIKSNNPKAPLETISNFNLSTFTGGYFHKESSSFNKIDNKEILGSFYLFENWNSKSKIETFTNRVYNINNLNFDLEEGKFLSKISRDSMYVYKNLKEVFINKKRFINIENKYYEVLVNGTPYSLIKNYYGVLKPAITNKMTNQLIKAPEYVAKYKYYLKGENDSSIKEVFLKKNTILKLLNTKKKGVNIYVKDKKISYKKEKDLIKIISYYNSL